MNWIHNNSNEPTTVDKLKELLKQSYKLVLVQQQELERMKNKSLHAVDSNYINSLYKHYIVEGKGKSYLY
jgi:hypothetical protein